MKYNYVVVEGNIGSGKTSLSNLIAERFNARLALESFSNNPFLPMFYENPEKFAFQLELFFLAERYQQLKNEISNRDLFAELTVSDYHFYKSLIFAQVNLHEDEFKLFSRLFHIIYPALPKPDLLVYLYLSTEQLQKNIRKRGRSYEQAISSEYLDRIQQSYFDFFRQERDMRILVIDTNNLDFVNNRDHLEQLVIVINRDYDPGMIRVTL